MHDCGCKKPEVKKSLLDKLIKIKENIYEDIANMTADKSESCLNQSSNISSVEVNQSEAQSINNPETQLDSKEECGLPIYSNVISTHTMTLMPLPEEESDNSFRQRLRFFNQSVLNYWNSKNYSRSFLAQLAVIGILVLVCIVLISTRTQKEIISNLIYE
jgi:hypothetical protein